MSQTATPRAQKEPSSPPVVLFDGECGLCDKSVKWLLRNDANAVLRFAPLQGETAAQLRTRYPAIPTELQSVVIVDGDRVYLRSKAFLQVSRYLRAPWRWMHPLRWLPAWLFDPGYWVVAKLRYRIWGKVDSCSVPGPGEAARMLP